MYHYLYFYRSYWVPPVVWYNTIPTINFDFFIFLFFLDGSSSTCYSSYFQPTHFRDPIRMPNFTKHFQDILSIFLFYFFFVFLIWSHFLAEFFYIEYLLYSWEQFGNLNIGLSLWWCTFLWEKNTPNFFWYCWLINWICLTGYILVSPVMLFVILVVFIVLYMRMGISYLHDVEKEFTGYARN